MLPQHHRRLDQRIPQEPSWVLRGRDLLLLMKNTLHYVKDATLWELW